MVYRLLNSDIDTGVSRGRYSGTQASVIAALAADDGIALTEITVTTLGPYVILEGSVPASMASRAIEIASAVVGCDCVRNRLYSW